MGRPLKTYNKTWYSKNKDKAKANHKKWFDKNPEHAKEIKRRWKLEKRFGITIEAYDALLQAQNYKCVICFKPQAELTKALCVDHNHSTGKIRGLLCHNCNNGLGLYYDSPANLRCAANYIERTNG